ncbi:hypothetical protein M5E87_25150 [Flavonifractor plautii]|nr:hypothetical protein M5E87_25150 [Flavonifractor plautii]
MSYTIISYVNTLVLNSVIGIAHGIQPLCSYHLGAEERPVCHKFLTYGIRLAACFAMASLSCARCWPGRWWACSSSRTAPCSPPRCPLCGCTPSPSSLWASMW